MEVNETSINRWMEVCCHNKLLDDLEELHEFLNLLWKWILEKNNPREVLQHIPSVGKFLGKLATNPTILMSEDIFKSLVRCIMALSNSTTSDGSSITKRTKMWAQAQVRNISTPTCTDNSVLAVAEVLGYTAEETTEFIAKQLGESIANEISCIPSYCWNSSASDCQPQLTISGENLRQISDICVPLVGNPISTPVIEALLCCNKATDVIERNQVTEALSPKFLEAVSNMLQNEEDFDKKGETNLSLPAKISLWKRCPSSFEIQVLNLLERTAARVPDITNEEIKDIISCSELCKACAECPQLCIYAWQLLRTALFHTHGSIHVFNLMQVFRQSCLDASHVWSCAGLMRMDFG